MTGFLLTPEEIKATFAAIASVTFTPDQFRALSLHLEQKLRATSQEDTTHD